MTTVDFDHSKLFPNSGTLNSITASGWTKYAQFAPGSTQDTSMNTLAPKTGTASVVSTRGVTGGGDIWVYRPLLSSVGGSAVINSFGTPIYPRGAHSNQPVGIILSVGAAASYGIRLSIAESDVTPGLIEMAINGVVEASSAQTTSAWVFAEIIWNGSTGQWAFYVGGVLAGSGTSATLAGATFAYVNYGSDNLVSPFTGSGPLIEDWRIFSDIGSFAPLGETSNRVWRPNADGTIDQWTPSNAGNSYVEIDGVYSALDYLSTATTGNITDTNTPSDDTGVFQVFSAGIIYVADRDDAVAANINGRFQVNGSFFAGATNNPGQNSPEMFTDIWETNPNTTAAWLPGDLALSALGFGIERQT